MAEMSCGETSSPYFQQMSLDLANGQAARIHPDHLVVEAGQASLVLGDKLRLERREAVARNIERQRAIRREHRLWAGAVAMIRTLPRRLTTGRLSLQMVRQLGSQHTLRELLLQSARQSRLPQHALRTLVTELSEQLIDYFVRKNSFRLALTRRLPLRVVGHKWLLCPCYDLHTQKSE